MQHLASITVASWTYIAMLDPRPGVRVRVGFPPNLNESRHLPCEFRVGPSWVGPRWKTRVERFCVGEVDQWGDTVRSVRHHDRPIYES